MPALRRSTPCRRATMNVTVLSCGTPRAAPRPVAGVVALPTRPVRPHRRLLTAAIELAGRLVPPAVVVGILLIVWELLCARKGSSLPPPSRVLAETWDLIVDPFFDRGGIDKGLFWHLSASLQ